MPLRIFFEFSNKQIEREFPPDMLIGELISQLVKEFNAPKLADDSDYG